MILKGEDCNTYRKIFRAGVRSSNEYVEIVEWYWNGKTEMFGEKYFTECLVEKLMNM
jgi:hypothetical protein